MVIFSIIAMCGAFFGFFLSLALINAKGCNHYANGLLAAFLCLSSLYLLGLVPLHGGWDVSRWWPRLGFLGLFVASPLLYAYVKAMTDVNFRITARHSLHLLPFILLTADILISGTNDQDYALAAQPGWPTNKYVVISLLSGLQLLAYIFGALLLLRRHGFTIVQQFSYQEGVNLRWLRILLNWYCAMALLEFAVNIARMFISVELWPRGIYSIGVTVSIYYLIAFMAIVQPAIFSRVGQDDSKPSVFNQSPPPNADPNQPPPQYETSSLSTHSAQQYWQQLQSHMQEQQPYLNSELRIKDLAASLTIPSNHLSQVINQCAQQNFFELVNQYRVEAAQEMLMDDKLKDVNISLIALDAGFNSQSAFYKQFKQRVGKTPKQYRQQLTS